MYKLAYRVLKKTIGPVKANILKSRLKSLYFRTPFVNEDRSTVQPLLSANFDDTLDQEIPIPGLRLVKNSVVVGGQSFVRQFSSSNSCVLKGYFLGDVEELLYCDQLIFDCTPYFSSISTEDKLSVLSLYVTRIRKGIPVRVFASVEDFQLVDSFCSSLSIQYFITCGSAQYYIRRSFFNYRTVANRLNHRLLNWSEHPKAVVIDEMSSPSAAETEFPRDLYSEVIRWDFLYDQDHSDLVSLLSDNVVAVIVKNAERVISEPLGQRTLLECCRAGLPVIVCSPLCLGLVSEWLASRGEAVDLSLAHCVPSRLSSPEFMLESMEHSVSSQLICRNNFLDEYWVPLKTVGVFITTHRVLSIPDIISKVKLLEEVKIWLRNTTSISLGVTVVTNKLPDNDRVIIEHALSSFDISLRHFGNVGVGFGLRESILKSGADYWLKIDDDDHYDRYYILERICGAQSFGALFSGKVAGLYYSTAFSEHVIRDNFWFDGWNRRHASGATLSGFTELFHKINFPDQAVGNFDVCFAREVRNAGIPFLIDSWVGFCVIRHAAENHTWRVSWDSLKQEGFEVPPHVMESVVTRYGGQRRFLMLSGVPQVIYVGREGAKLSEGYGAGHWVPRLALGRGVCLHVVSASGLHERCQSLKFISDNVHPIVHIINQPDMSGLTQIAHDLIKATVILELRTPLLTVEGDERSRRIIDFSSARLKAKSIFVSNPFVYFSFTEHDTGDVPYKSESYLCDAEFQVVPVGVRPDLIALSDELDWSNIEKNLVVYLGSLDEKRNPQRILSVLREISDVFDLKPVILSTTNPFSDSDCLGVDIYVNPSVECIAWFLARSAVGISVEPKSAAYGPVVPTKVLEYALFDIACYTGNYSANVELAKFGYIVSSTTDDLRKLLQNRVALRSNREISLSLSWRKLIVNYLDVWGFRSG